MSVCIFHGAVQLTRALDITQQGCPCPHAFGDME
jgi:hypothetical protein